MSRRTLTTEELGRLANVKIALRAATQTVNALDASSSTHAVRDAHTAIQRIARALQAIAHPTLTSCTHHPHGPVDPDPPEGWSRCLLCNSRRRTANKADTIPEKPRW